LFAEFEKNLIVERVNAGLDRARKQGKQLGRRRVVVDREKVRELHKAGNSTRMIAATMGLTKSTVFNIVNGQLIETFLRWSNQVEGDHNLIAPMETEIAGQKGTQTILQGQTSNHPGLSCQCREGSTACITQGWGVPVPDNPDFKVT
jgi:hypothetical protein